MCGIAGFLCATDLGEPFVSETIGRMTRTVRHRGPDRQGVWYDVPAGVALGHRRLSVVDLSTEGDQPMISPSGRYVISFNGEVYNHAEIRKELERRDSLIVPWRGHSDTEVMLAAIDAWGLEMALPSFVGMFAFALWDRKLRLLYLVRDRLGEKPLYYGYTGPVFLFGSELKALKAYPEFTGTVDRAALALLMKLGYVPAPYSIYSGVRKLPPGNFLCVAAGGDRSGQLRRPEPYWRAEDAAREGLAHPYAGTEDEAVAELQELLLSAVAGQSVADVPVGAFLSGGVDSSLIVALLQAAGSTRVRTFTIGFAEEEFDEAAHARTVAALLGTDHTELRVTPGDALAAIPTLPLLYDEPFSDPSQIPTYLVARMTRQHVTVSLSGDGGDELFGGYSRYQVVPRIWNSVRWIPPHARAALAEALDAAPPWLWDAGFGWARSLSGRFGPAGKLSQKMKTLSYLMPARSFASLYARTTRSPLDLVNEEVPPEYPIMNLAGRIPAEDHAVHMMFRDLLTYLPDDILVKVDRAAMSVGLETRMPFLDHRVVEFALRLPAMMKIRKQEGKWILKQLLANYLPRPLIDRPKMGFCIPLARWLRGPLRPWAEDLLDGQRLRAAGYLQAGAVRTVWEDLLAERNNRHLEIWNVLMFQAWLRQR